MIWHPSRNDLLAYAETVANDATPVNAAVAAHLAECRYCASEVDEIGETLRIADCTESIEPSRECHASLLLAARNERRIASSRWGRMKSVQALAYAALMLLVAGTLLAVVGPGDETSDTPRIEKLPMVELRGAAVFPLDALLEPLPEDDILSAAVVASQRSPLDRWEEEQWRTVSTLDDDIEEALDALRDNPACVRASELVSANRKRMNETLKTLYAERSL